MRVLHRFALIVLFALVLPLMLLSGWLAYSNSGLVWLLSRFEHTLQVDAVEGSLFGRFSLKGLNYSSASVNLSIEDLVIHWQPARLLAGDLAISSLSLTGLQGASTPSGPRSEISGLKLPIDISVKQATAERLVWNSLQMDSIKFSGSLNDNVLDIFELRLSAPQYAAQTTGSIDLGLQPHGAVRLEQQLLLQPAEGLPISLNGNIAGNWAQLDIRQNIAPPYQAEIKGTVGDVLLAGRTSQLTVTLSDASLPFAASQSGISGLSGELKFDSAGSATNTEVDIALHSDRLADDLELHLLGSVSADSKRLEIRNLNLSTATAATNRQPTAPLDLTAQPPGLSLSGTVSDYQALMTRTADSPATSDADINLKAQWLDASLSKALFDSAISSPRGSIEIAGALDNYQIAIDIELEQTPNQIDKARASMLGLTGRLLAAGSGDLQQLDFPQISLSGFAGTASGQARLNWQGPLAWSTELGVSDLRTDLFIADWPGRINANVVSKGSQSAAGLTASIKADKISGRLREMPLRAVLDLDIVDQQLQVNALNASLGSSSIELQGQLGEDSDLRYKIVSPDLRRYSESLGGSIDAAGRLLGNISSPRLSGRIRATQLGYRQWQAASVNADFDVGTASATDPWNAELVVNGVSLAQEPLVESSTISLTGRAQDHKLSLRNSFFPQIENSIDITANWKAATWSGSLQRFEISDAGSNNWALSERADFSLSRQLQSLSKLCLNNTAPEATEQSLCVGLREAKDHFIADLNIKRLPTALFDSALSKYGFNLRGDIHSELEAKFSLRSNYPASLVGSIRSESGSINYRLAAPPDAILISKKTRPLDRQLDYSNFEIAIDAGELTRIKLAANLEDNGYLRGTLEINDSLFSDSLRNATISGVATALLPDISVLSTSSTGTLSLGGTLQADLKLAGQLQNPSLDLNMESPMASCTCRKPEYSSVIWPSM